MDTFRPFHGSFVQHFEIEKRGNFDQNSTPTKMKNTNHKKTFVLVQKGGSNS